MEPALTSNRIQTRDAGSIVFLNGQSQMRWTTYLIDGVIGLSCLVIGTILFILIGAHGSSSMIHINISHPILILLLGMAPFFLAGFIRTVSQGIHPWLRGISIALGAIVPVLVITALLFHTVRYPLLWVFASLSALVGFCGSMAKQLCQGRRFFAATTIAIASIFIVVASGKVALQFDKNSNQYQEVHKVAPAATFELLDGPTISMASLKGWVVVLDFWGTWCIPCIEELPGLDHIYTEYQGNMKVAFLAVNSELNGDTADRIRIFVRSRHLHMPMALDANGMTIQSLGINSFPTLLVIDRHGIIRMQTSGEDDPKDSENRLTNEIAQLIQEK